MKAKWVILLVVAASVGCARWTVPAEGPRSVLASTPPKVLITLSDSSQSILASPVLRSDTIVGYHESWRGRVDSAQVVSIPLDQVRSLATWYEGPTWLPVVGLVALPLILLISGILTGSST